MKDFTAARHQPSSLLILLATHLSECGTNQILEEGQDGDYWVMLFSWCWSLSLPISQRLQTAPCQWSRHCYLLMRHHHHPYPLLLYYLPMFVFISLVLSSFSFDRSSSKLTVPTVSSLLPHVDHLSVDDFVFEINELLDVNTGCMAALRAAIYSSQSLSADNKWIYLIYCYILLSVFHLYWWGLQETVSMSFI